MSNTTTLRAEDIPPLQRVENPARSDIVLHDYQTLGVLALRTMERVLLADEVGLGKTPTALYAAEPPCLIVCPGYLKRMWAAAILKFLPGCSVNLVDGIRAVRHEMLKERCWDFTIVNYEMLHSTYQFYEDENGNKVRVVPATDDYPELFERNRWQTIIFDEAHYLRKHTTNWTKQAWKLKSKYCFLLTATPFVKDGGDFYGLLRTLNKKEFTSYWAFVREHCEIGYDPYAGETVGKIKNIPDFRQRVLSRYMLRREEETLRLLGIELPAVTVTRVPVECPKGLKDRIKKVKKEYRDPDTEEAFPNAGALVMRIRNWVGTAPTKVNATIEAALSHESERQIIWCYFHKTAEALREALKARYGKGWYRVVTGEMPHTQRDAILRDFERREDGILVATLGSLGLGANLQFCRRMILHEYDYLATTQEQAVGRIRRLGGHKMVHVLTMVLQGTIDEHILAVAEGRFMDGSAALAELVLRELEDA